MRNWRLSNKWKRGDNVNQLAFLWVVLYAKTSRKKIQLWERCTYKRENDSSLLLWFSFIWFSPLLRTTGYLQKVSVLEWPKAFGPSKPPKIVYTLWFHFINFYSILIHPSLASRLIILSKHLSLKSPMATVSIQVLLEADSEIELEVLHWG